MKVTHTVLHLENEQEKEMLIKAVAKEVVSKAEVASISNNGYEAELNQIPQFAPPTTAMISTAELQDIEPKVCSYDHYDCEDDQQETQSPIRTLTSYLFKHKDGKTVTPVYVSRVEEPIEEEDIREAKKEAALKLFKLLSQTPGREEDRRISNRDMISLITANRMTQPIPPEEDEVHVFTSEDGQEVEVPESLIYHIKNNM
nr:MAG TPA: hypothetical protein [Caudoviricetes sp.]